MNTTSAQPFYRLPITARYPDTAIGSLVLGVLFFAFALLVAQLPVIEALIGAVIGVVMHWTLEILHHLGHAYAAMRTGYPMRGVRLGIFWILGASLYPKDEPTIPARLHIQRALGGPILSGLIGLVFLVLVLLTREDNTLIAWLLRLGLLESLIMSVGAMMPLSFLDGGSILYWLRH